MLFFKNWTLSALSFICLTSFYSATSFASEVSVSPKAASAPSVPVVKVLAPQNVPNTASSVSADKSIASDTFNERALTEYKAKNYPKAKEIWLQGLKANERDSQHVYGLWYLLGEENMKIKPDIPSAIDLLKKAAAQNKVEAQYMLAKAYQDGQLVPKDMKKSLSYYEAAAKNGSAVAEFDLAKMYMAGDGVEKNEKKGMALFEQSAAHNFEDAQIMLGAFYYKGEYVKEDKKEALKRFEQVANKNNAQAQLILGMHYLGEENKIEAYKWAKLSMRAKGSSTAYTLLEKVKASLSPEELLDAEKQVKAWKPNSLPTSVVKK